MHKLFLGFFGHVLEATKQMVSQIDAISVWTHSHEGLVILKSMMEGVA